MRPQYTLSDIIEQVQLLPEAKVFWNGEERIMLDMCGVDPDFARAVYANAADLHAFWQWRREHLERCHALHLGR